MPIYKPGDDRNLKDDVTLVQIIDKDGNKIDGKKANEVPTANTYVLPVQTLDAAGSIIDGTTLPTDAATETKQDVGNADLAIIAADTTSVDTKLDSQATAANQATANASLGVIEADTTSLDGKITKADTDNVIISDPLPTGTNILGVVNTNAVNGVPTTFTKQSQVSDNFPIIKGNLNKLRLRSQIQNEHCESSREAQATVGAAQLVGQIFRASNVDINGLSLTLESATAFASFDAIAAGVGEHKLGTMEYSGDVAMQTEYVKSGADEMIRSTFTDDDGVTQDGSWAGKIDMSGVVGDEWRGTTNSTDLTAVIFSLKFASTRNFNDIKLYFFVGDGTNTKSFPLTNLAEDLWQTITFSESGMNVEATDDTVTTPNMAAITKMGFRIVNRRHSEFAYVDSITYQAEPGHVNLELWDMGVALPTGGVTALDDGTQYTEIGDRGIGGVVVSQLSLSLLGGKRKYHVDGFIAGVAREIPANTLLTVDNYYAIVIRYVDTDVTVYGPNTSYAVNYYTNGFSFTTPDDATAITKLGTYNDCSFQVFSTQQIYLIRANLFTQVAPAVNADVIVFIEDSNMSITDIPITNQKGGQGRIQVNIDLTLHPPVMDVGGKFEAYYNDDPMDDVSNILFTMDYLYVPPTVHG